MTKGHAIGRQIDAIPMMVQALRGVVEAVGAEAPASASGYVVLPAERVQACREALDAAGVPWAGGERAGAEREPRAPERRR